MTVAEFRSLGLGFRDIRLYETTNLIHRGNFNLESLYNLDTESARAQLLNLSGVGPKVAAGLGNAISAADFEPTKFILLQQTTDRRSAQKQHGHQIFDRVAASILYYGFRGRNRSRCFFFMIVHWIKPL